MEPDIINLVFQSVKVVSMNFKRKFLQQRNWSWRKSFERFKNPLKGKKTVVLFCLIEPNKWLNGKRPLIWKEETKGWMAKRLLIRDSLKESPLKIWANWHWTRAEPIKWIKSYRLLVYPPIRSAVSVSVSVSLLPLCGSTMRGLWQGARVRLQRWKPSG